MNLYIGKLQSDGVVKYIVIHDQRYFRDVPQTLKTFYKTAPRVDALLNLGNLVKLQPSPYNKWKGHDDKINCRAEIRDDNEKKGKHLPQYSDTIEEYARINAWQFLYMNGRWHFRTQNGFKDLQTVDIDFTEEQSSFEGISFYKLSEEGALSSIFPNQFTNWKDLRVKAVEENDTYFAFRDNKLITTINHPLNN